MRLPRFSWRRRASVDDFADAIRAELVEMPTPPADDALLARILASRRDGARVILPTADAPSRRRAVFYVSAIAAAAAAVVTISTLNTERREEPTLDVVHESWLGGSVAFAQTTPPARLTYAPVVVRPERMRAMALHYRHTMRSLAGATSQFDGWVELVRDSVDGVPAWRATSVSKPAGRILTDSAWVAVADLRPLRRVAEDRPYSQFERIRVEQRYAGARVTGDMRAWKSGAVVAHRVFDRRLAPDFAPYVADALGAFYVAAMPIGAGWTGSFSLMGWAVRDDDVFVTVDLRVDGEERVRVPAGEFACWKLAMQYAGRRAWFWVRKSDGIGVRSLDSTDARTKGVREMQLLKQ